MGVAVAALFQHRINADRRFTGISPPARDVRGTAWLNPGEGILRMSREGEEVIERTVLVLLQRLVRNHLGSQLIWWRAPLDDDCYQVIDMVYACPGK